MIFLLCSIVATIAFAGKILIVEDEARPVDAIVVIGGDHKPQRMQKAVELYLLEHATLVIISAGTLVLEGTEIVPEAEVMMYQALELGLPEDVIVIEDASNTTIENARFTKQFLETHEIDSILLVTSAYHSRRARRIFTDEFGENISVVMQPARPINNTFLWIFHGDEAYVVGYEYWNWAGYWLRKIKNESIQISGPVSRLCLVARGV